MERKKIRINILDDTGIPVEETDVYTNADSVLFTADTTLPQELDRRLLYSTNIPIPKDIGGVIKGSTFLDTDIKDIIDKILHPYAYPEVSFSITPNDLIYEKGYTLPNIMFRIKIIKTSEMISSVQLIKDGVKVLEHPNFPRGGGEEDLLYDNPINSNSTFYIRIFDGVEYYNSSPITIKFINPLYIGTVGVDTMSISQSDLSSLDKILSDITIGASYKFTMVNRRMVICLPSEYSLVSILDQNRFDMINSFSNVGNFIVRINNENITYKYYISNPTTQTDFKVNFRINK